MYILSKKNEILSVIIFLLPISISISPFINTVVIILGVLFSILCIIKNKARINIKRYTFIKYIVVFYILYLIIHIIGIIYSLNLKEAFSLIRIRLPILLIPIIFISLYKKIDYNKVFKYFMYSILIICILTNVRSIYSIISHNEPLSFFYTKNIRFIYKEFMPYGIHPPYFGILLNLAMLNCYYELLSKKSFKYVIFSMILIINLILLASQMTFITFIVILALVFLYWIYLRINRKVFLLITILTLSLGTYILTNGEQFTEYYISELKIENSNNILKRINHLYKKKDLTRIRNWESGFFAIKENPIFGAGTGDAIDQMLKFRHKKSWIYLEKLNAHNQYLEEFVRFGMIGGISFILIFLIIGIMLLRKKMLFNFGILIIILLSMMTESILDRQIGVFIATFFISFSIFSYLKKIQIEENNAFYL
ncbi:O-antigen ligase family protein [Aquimarina rhabdastrellae]